VRIDPGSLHHIGRSSAGRVTGSGVEGTTPLREAAAAPASAGADQLELSSRAEEIRTARAALAQTPEVRADKVAELKAQIEAGTYRVDADKVAERILNPRG